MKEGYYRLQTMCSMALSQVRKSTIDDQIAWSCVILIFGLTVACRLAMA